jgi:hypothetical protein
MSPFPYALNNHAIVATVPVGRAEAVVAAQAAVDRADRTLRRRCVALVAAALTTLAALVVCGPAPRWRLDAIVLGGMAAVGALTMAAVRAINRLSAARLRQFEAILAAGCTCATDARPGPADDLAGD